MGLSFRNITKKIGSIAGGVERQLNPFDNNMTYKQKKPTGNASVFHQLTHNGVTNFVGNNVVKPVAQFPLDASQQLYSHVVAPTFHLPTFHNNPQAVPGFIGSVSRKVGANGSLHQLVGSGVQTALTIGSGGASNLIEGGVKSALADTAPRLVTRFAPRVTSNAAIAGGFGASSAAGNNESVGNIVKSGLTTAAIGSAIPVAGAAAKGAIRVTPKVVRLAAKAPGKAAAQWKAANPGMTHEAAKAEVKAAVKATAQEDKLTASQIRSTPALKAPVVATGKAAGRTGIPEIDQAINDVSTAHRTPIKYGGTARDVIGKAQNETTLAQRRANTLGKAVSKLDKKENVAISDFLDSGKATADLTPRALKVANSLKSLDEQAGAIRRAVDPNTGQVEQYSTRIGKRSLKGTSRASTGGGDSVIGQIRNLTDLHNLKSTFSQERMKDKFVGKSGTLVGHPKDLGLTPQGKGIFKDADGNVFAKKHATKRELEAAGAGNYEHSQSAISRIYHSDTGALKARAEAVQALQKNPKNYGLLTEEEVRAQGLKNYAAITKLPNLRPNKDEFYFAPKADVKDLEDSFAFKTPENTNLALKAYDTASNVATRFIVLNPIFHGANQLVQAGIAAGNLPGIGNGWYRGIKAVATVNEGDVRKFFENPANHSPDYGAAMTNILSEITHGTTKIPSKMMADIELKLRVGLYKASIESGMDATKAAENINLFMGDKKAINATVRRATLFAHYFKTMAKSIGTQVSHPIEQKGSIVNTATITGILAAMSYGWQQFTGNPNANVRLPGEIGLGEQAIKSVKEVAGGELPSIVMNRINPVAKEGAQQAFHKDLFTGKDITGSDRLTHARDALIAPAQIAGRAASGKRSNGEILLNQFQLNEPHAKGNPAAPSGRANFLNTPGAKVAAGNDPTGYQQQQAYFSTTKAVKKGLSSSDAKLYDTLTSSTSKMNDKQIQGHYQDLAANPKVLDAVTQQKQQEAKLSGTKLDPLYAGNITSKQRQQYLHMLSLPYKGDDYVQQKGNKNSWMQKLTTDRSKYFDALDKSGQFTGVSAAERVKPPVFSSKTQANLDAAGNLYGAEKGQFIADHPDIQKAYDAIAKYTNDKRVAQGNAPFKLYPKADARTSAVLKAYNALPKHDGKKGGNATRARWIKAHPAENQLMQNYYTRVSEYQLANSAGANKYEGTRPNQAELKAAYSLGNYDIIKKADGTYSVDPKAVSSSKFGSYGSSSKKVKYSNPYRYKVSSSGAHFRKATIKTGSYKGVKKYQVKRVTPVRNRKVALRHSKV